MVKKLPLLAVLASILFLTGCCPGHAETTVKQAVQKQNSVVVYYFYAKPRCTSCKKIETYTEEAVKALNNSKVVYRAVNLDTPENKHYYKDYGLYTKAVVLSEVKEEKELKYKNLDKIWTKLRDEQKFKKYITDEISDFAGN